jgi:hypothetical protein
MKNAKISLIFVLKIILKFMKILEGVKVISTILSYVLMPEGEIASN